MTDQQHFHDLITTRLSELGIRMQEIEQELSHPIPAHLEDQAIDLEDDEVLSGLGVAAQKEVLLLKRALKRIADGTYGTCLECGEPISPERLEAVLYAPLCRNCAGTQKT